MDSTWSPLGVDNTREVSVYYHPTATPLQMVTGTHVDSFNLTPMVTAASQTNKELRVTLNWHDEIYGASQTQAGRIIEVRLETKTLWWGIIEAIDEYRHEIGTRSLSVVSRTRDASTAWRTVRRVSELWPVQTPLNAVADSIARSLGLTDVEIAIPLVSATTVHSNTQLADMTAWEMLEQLMLPVGGSPMVSATGRLKVVNRDTTRPADIVVTADRIKSVSSSKSRAPLTKVLVKWLSPTLTEVAQQRQLLWDQTITFGFFQKKLVVPIPYSDDKLQRVRNIQFVVISKIDAGGGIYPNEFIERFDPYSQFEGRLLLYNKQDVAKWFLFAIAAIGLIAVTPDTVTTAPGETFPIGRIVTTTVLTGVLNTMSKIGTGHYQVWGNPYDYVYGRNTTEAVSASNTLWTENELVVDNDFVMNEDMAQAFATRELVYGVRSSVTYSMTMVDDPRVEEGDILELPDKSRLYVVSYSRDLTPGASAMLTVQGFRV